mmetsp:Transcript_53575/g.88955  ORF Transcript_53575/g.88955 Transcript_53575/m.88955 type:complete len:404 (-) Transcript_53575:174-1385(-)
MPSAIFWRYVRSHYLLVDSVSVLSLPLSYLAPSFASLCIVRLAYVVNFSKKFEIATKMSPSVARSVELATVVFLVLHWIACLWCNMSERQDSWFDAYVTTGNGDEHKRGDRWYIYTCALYWSLDTASTRGSGDVLPQDHVELLVSLITVTLSTLLYAAIIANMSSLFLSSDSTWNEHRKRVEVVKAFMLHKKLPPMLRQRIQMFLDYSWTTQKGIDEEAVLAKLPETLRQQVMLFCAEHLISKVPLFKGCTPTLKTAIMESLVTRTYVPDDVIVSKGELGSECFMIDKGVVCVLGNDNLTPFRYLFDGAYFGELAVLFKTLRTRTVAAVTHCYLYALHYIELERVLRDNPLGIDELISNMYNLYDVREVERAADLLPATLGEGEVGPDNQTQAAPRSKQSQQQ